MLSVLAYKLFKFASKELLELRYSRGLKRMKSSGRITGGPGGAWPP